MTKYDDVMNEFSIDTTAVENKPKPITRKQLPGGLFNLEDRFEKQMIIITVKEWVEGYQVNRYQREADGISKKVVNELRGNIVDILKMGYNYEAWDNGDLTKGNHTYEATKAALEAGELTGKEQVHMIVSKAPQTLAAQVEYILRDNDSKSPNKNDWAFNGMMPISEFVYKPAYDVVDKYAHNLPKSKKQTIARILVGFIARYGIDELNGIFGYEFKAARLLRGSKARDFLDVSFDDDLDLSIPEAQRKLSDLLKTGLIACDTLKNDPHVKQAKMLGNFSDWMYIILAMGLRDELEINNTRSKDRITLKSLITFFTSPRNSSKIAELVDGWTNNPAAAETGFLSNFKIQS